MPVLSEDAPDTISSAPVTTAPSPSPLIYGLSTACLILPFLLVPGTFNYSDFPKRVAVQILATILLILLIALRKESRQNAIIVDHSSLLAAAFILWSFLSLLWAVNTHEGLQIVIHWASCAAVFFVAQNSIRTCRDFEPLGVALTLAGAAVAIIGISQYLFDISFIPQSEPPAATFGNKNIAAHFIVLVWPLSIYSLVTGAHLRRSWLTVSASALMLVFIIFSATKAAWIAMGIEALLVVVFIVREINAGNSVLSWGRKKTFAVTAAFILILVVSVSGIALHQNQARADSKHALLPASGLTSSSIRLIIWSNALAALSDAPALGWGAGSFDSIYSLYYDKGKLDPQFSETISPVNVHNDYLQIAVELGLTGLVIGAFFVLTLLVKMRALVFSSSPQIRLLTIMITAAITGGAVNAFFDFPMRVALPPFLMMLMCGVLCGLYAHAQDSPGKLLSPMLRIPVTLLLVIAAVFLIRYHFLGFKAYAHYFNVIQLSEAQRWPETYQEGKKAINLLPGIGDVYTYIGKAQIKMGQPRQAAASLDWALTYYPNSLTVLKFSGIAHAAAGSLDHAAARFTRYLEIKPDVAEVHELLADTYRRQGKLEKALDELLLGADLEPDDGKRYIEVGQIAEEYNHHLFASEAFSKAVALRPDWGDAHYYYGSSLYRLNRKVEGAQHLRRALELGVTPQTAATISHLLATE